MSYDIDDVPTIYIPNVPITGADPDTIRWGIWGIRLPVWNPPYIPNPDFDPYDPDSIIYDINGNPKGFMEIPGLIDNPNYNPDVIGQIGGNIYYPGETPILGPLSPEPAPIHIPPMNDGDWILEPVKPTAPESSFWDELGGYAVWVGSAVTVVKFMRKLCHRNVDKLNIGIGMLNKALDKINGYQSFFGHGIGLRNDQCLNSNCYATWQACNNGITNTVNDLRNQVADLNTQINGSLPGQTPSVPKIDCEEPFGPYGLGQLLQKEKDIEAQMMAIGAAIVQADKDRLNCQKNYDGCCFGYLST